MDLLKGVQLLLDEKEENKSGRSRKKKQKEERSSWEIQLEQESKAATKRMQNRIEANQIKVNYLDDLNQYWFVEKDYSKTVGLIIRWGTQIGFKNMTIENWVASDINNFVKMVYNKWLSLQPGCKAKLFSKWKKPKDNRFEDEQHRKIIDELVNYMESNNTIFDKDDFKEIAKVVNDRKLGSGKLEEEVTKEFVIRQFCKKVQF